MKTKLLIERAQVKKLLEGHIAATLVGTNELKEFTIHRNGSIEMTVQDVTEAPALPLEPEPES